MPEEMVIWVDDNGKPIKPIPISLANSDPQYLHLEVAVIIVDRDNRVLLQKRAHTKTVSPDVWTVTAAGHITWGDKPEDTAHRELEEEMGIKVDKLYSLFHDKVTLDHERHIVYWFIGIYLGDEIHLQASEVDDYAWIDEFTAKQFVQTHTVSPQTQKMLKRYWSGEWKDLLK